MMRRCAFLSLLAFLVSLHPGIAAEPPADLIEAAHAIMGRQVAGWNAMDAEMWAADFAEDSDFVNIIGMYFTDREQNVRRHAHLFDTIFRGSTLAADIVRIRPVVEDVALVETHFTLTGHHANPPGVRNTEPGVLRTHIKFVLQRIDGEWRVIAAQNTAIAPTS